MPLAVRQLDFGHTVFPLMNSTFRYTLIIHRHSNSLQAYDINSFLTYQILHLLLSQTLKVFLCSKLKEVPWHPEQGGPLSSQCHVTYW